MIRKDTISYTGTKQSRTFMSNIIAMIIVAFDFIVLIVCLLIIRFRIINTIEDSITNIGALKAMGYVNWDIALSYLLQFLIISTAGIILSFGAAFGCMIPIKSVIENQSGMSWNMDYHMGIIGLCSLGLLVLISAIVLLTSRRLSQLRSIHNHLLSN